LSRNRARRFHDAANAVNSAKMNKRPHIFCGFPRIAQRKNLLRIDKSAAA
jgi:hypothetical protein